MTTERISPVPFDEAVKARFKGAIDKLSSNSAVWALHKALYNKHAAIDWTQARPDAEVNNMIGSTFASVRYAYITTGRKDLLGLAPASVDAWEQAADTVLKDKEMSAIFYKNLGRPITTAGTTRGIPVHYVLKDYFIDRKDGLTGVDLGAGMGITLPLINSGFYTESKFAFKEVLVKKFGGYSGLTISQGVSVDIQNGRNDKDWITASNWPEEAGNKITYQINDVIESINASTAFPFVVADVLADNCYDKIMEVLPGTKISADFVLTSFMRYQLGKADAPAQKKLRSLIGRLLAPEGIWIDMGEELLEDTGDKTYSKVVIYKKGGEDEDLQRLGVPFALRDQTRIEAVNYNYFLGRPTQGTLFLP